MAHFYTHLTIQKCIIYTFTCLDAKNKITIKQNIKGGDITEIIGH